MSFNLVYISKASKPMQDAENLLILEQARRYNKAHGITGMLLYIEGSFLKFEGGRYMQALEGEEEYVRSLFSKISYDNRHFDVIQLYESTLEKRNFEDWSMGFASLDKNVFDNTPGSFSLNDFFLKTFHSEISNVPIDFLKSFYRMNL